MSHLSTVILIVIFILGAGVVIWYPQTANTVPPAIQGAATNYWTVISNCFTGKGCSLNVAGPGQPGSTSPPASASTPSPPTQPQPPSSTSQTISNQQQASGYTTSNYVHPIGLSVDQTTSSPVFYFCPTQNTTLTTGAQVNSITASSSPNSVQQGYCAYWTANLFPGLTMTSGQSYPFAVAGQSVTFVKS